MTNEKMMEMYKEWRKVSEEMLADGFSGSLDCGEGKVREDFSDFARLEEEITYEEMRKLQNEYEYMCALERDRQNGCL